jgi:hypothetical protein
MRNISRKCDRQQFWENHIAQCMASGMSQVEYCRLNRIGIKSFQYWKRKFRRNGAPALVEVSLPKSFPSPALYPQLCLVIGRYRVEIDSGFDSEVLERVIRTLGRI